MTDPHLNAEQLFGFKRVSEQAVFGGKNGTCQQVARATGKPPPLLPWTGSRAMFRAEIEGENL